MDICESCKKIVRDRWAMIDEVNGAGENINFCNEDCHINAIKNGII